MFLSSSVGKFFPQLDSETNVFKCLLIVLIKMLTLAISSMCYLVPADREAAWGGAFLPTMAVTYLYIINGGRLPPVLIFNEGVNCAKSQPV